MLGRAIEHHRLGRFEQAAAIYREILAREPEHADALHLLGLLHAQAGEPNEGLALIERAIALKPDAPDYHNNYGEILCALGQTDAAVAAYRKALQLRPDSATTHCNLGNALQEQGDLEAAIEAYRRVIALAPNDATAHNNLGLALGKQDKHAEAIAHLEQARRLDPQSAEICFNLGNALATYKKCSEAIAVYREATVLNPDFPEAYYRLGRVFMLEGNVSGAIAAYERAIDLKPDYAEAYYYLGNALLQDHRSLREAATAYRTAYRLQPKSPEILNPLAGALLRIDDLRGAIECYRTALRVEPGNTNVWFNLGLALEQAGQTAEAVDCFLQAAPTHIGAFHCLVDLTPSDEQTVARLKGLLDQPRLSEADAESLRWALGKACDDCGRFEEAFRYYEDANRRRRTRTGLGFDRAGRRAEVSDLIGVFSAALMQEKERLGDPSEVPVFITGLSRSGKSLTEQLLSKHPAVHGAGEMAYFGLITRELPQVLGSSKPYPACVPDLDAGSAQTLAQSYLEELRARSPRALRVVNSAPNVTELGLIALLFPKARIVHCQRDALDLCLSIYFKSFAPGHAYAYDLEDIAFYYGEYQRLMRHWYDVLGKRILPLSYERLVSEPDAVAGELIDWFGLDRESLRPESVEWDGSRGLQGRFVGHWKNYARFIGALQRGLEKATD